MRLRKIAYAGIMLAMIVWLTLKCAIPAVHDRCQNLSFCYYQKIAKQIKDATGLVLYEGLPHPTFKSGLYEVESSRSDIVEMDGELFYKQILPLTTSKTLSEKLLIGRKEAQKAQEKLEKNHFVA